MAADFSLVRYSISHFSDFRKKGCTNWCSCSDERPARLWWYAPSFAGQPTLWTNLSLTELKTTWARQAVQPGRETLHYGGYIRDEFRHVGIRTHSYLQPYRRLVFHGGCRTEDGTLFSWIYQISSNRVIDARQLYHILLPTPTPYDVQLSRG